MNPHPALEVFVNWLLNQSLQAGILVLVVLFVQWTLRNQLTARWRFALWWLVLLLLLLPFRPQSAFSLFNYCRAYVELDGPRYPVPVATMPSVAPAATSLPLEVPPPFGLDPAPAPTEKRAEVQAGPADAPATGTGPAASKLAEIVTGVAGARTFDFDELLLPGLAALWLLGALVLAGYVLQQALRFQRQLARTVRPVEDAALALLDDCRRELGVRRHVELLETEAVKSPALFGLFRLRLLLPTGLTARFSREQLRFIFLHELAHVKRGDLWLNWLVTALQIMHWFNPLLWLGFARLRADRELACDELALLHAEEGVGKAYGQTIIQLLEGFSHPTAIPGLVGIVEDKQQMQRRIQMIARFKKPSRWSALAVVLLLGLGVVGLTNGRTREAGSEAGALSANSAASGGTTESPTDRVKSETITAEAAQPTASSKQTIPSQSASRPDLGGKVVSANGKPVEHASVFIYTARPKVGAGVLCPSCYADCRKYARTDARGAFLIESLDPTLLFRVLVAAPGYRPEFVSKVDPAGGPIEVKLQETVRGNTDPNCRVFGRVLSPDGKPVEGAIVSPNGVSAGGVTRWGSVRDMEPLAVSDAHGKFSLYGSTPFDTVSLTVESRGFARRTFNKLASGSTPHELTVTEGASVSGRVVEDGKPLPDVEVGICGANRRSGEFVGYFTVATGEDGRFLFVNLPPDTDYFIYGQMDSLKAIGAVLARRLRVGADGTTQQAGELMVFKAHRLEGRLALSNGKPVPPDTQVMLNRPEAWDQQRSVVDAEGRFAFAGVPDEVVRVSTSVNGYRFSAQNASLDTLNPYYLVGRVKSDKKDLVVLLEPGGRQEGLRGPSETTLRELPLRGIERPQPGPETLTVSGRVLDSATGQPVKTFTVREGYRDRSFGEVAYLPGQQVSTADGLVTLQLEKSARLQAQFVVEAEGYQPKSSEFISETTTGLVIKLEKGSGPASVVLLPDGRFAVKTTVYLCDMRNGVYMSEPGTVRESAFRGTETTWTDEQGRFAFKPRPDAYCVTVVHEAGYAQVPIERLQQTGKVQIEKWSRVTGRLFIGAKSVPNESVKLGLLHIPYLYEPRHFAPLSLHYSTTTDAEGRFTFEKVPPLDVAIYHSPKVHDSQLGIVPQSQERFVRARPGVTAEITLGGEGRPVTGRVVLKGYDGTIDWRRDVHNLLFVRPDPPEIARRKKLGEDYATKSRSTADKEKLMELRADYEPRQKDALEKEKAFYRTEAGRAYVFSSRRYALNFQQDGTFRVEDVPAGDYQLSIRLGEPGGERSFPIPSQTLATLQTNITIPAMPGGRSDEPLDLGTLTMSIREPTKAAAKKPYPVK